jgi:aldose 1-epimerase
MPRLVNEDGKMCKTSAWRAGSRAFAWCLLTIAMVPAISLTASGTKAHITAAAFGWLPDGRAVELYTLRNRRGMEARIMTYGGIVTYLSAPDKHGHLADVVLGYDSLVGYLKASPYFGALIGRYGNRIANGHFSLQGSDYSLPINSPPNSLHGGAVGFDKVLWTVAAARVTTAGPELTLEHLSPDGDQGYPGNLHVTAVYTLTEDNGLRVDFTATTDRVTVVNLTNHSYFNLRGAGDVLGHVVQIHADRFTPIDETLIPTGELRSVEGTPFDFRTPTAIGAHIEADNEQLRFGRGYDHNWVVGSLAEADRSGLRLDATVYEPESGRVLEVLSTQPGLQFYSGNFLDGTLTGKGGRVYERHAAFCVEPQHFPDSPNHAEFPSTVLRPGEVYRQSLEFRFTVH